MPDDRCGLAEPESGSVQPSSVLVPDVSGALPPSSSTALEAISPVAVDAASPVAVSATCAVGVVDRLPSSTSFTTARRAGCVLADADTEIAALETATAVAAVADPSCFVPAITPVCNDDRPLVGAQQHIRVLTLETDQYTPDPLFLMFPVTRCHLLTFKWARSKSMIRSQF